MSTLRDSYDAIVMAAERRGTDAFWCPQTILLQWHEIHTGQHIRPDSFNRHLKKLRELGKVYTKTARIYDEGKPGTWFFLSESDYLSSGNSLAEPEHERVMAGLVGLDLDTLQDSWQVSPKPPVYRKTREPYRRPFTPIDEGNNRLIGPLMPFSILRDQWGI